MSVAALIAGAGSGTRLGASKPKALVELASEPLIVHAVRGMNAAGVDNCVVTIPEGGHAEFSEALARAGLSATLVVGGDTRQSSVSRGLAAIDTDYVLIHDAARCLTPPHVIRAVIDTLTSGHGAVVPALPVTDTIKEVAGAPGSGAPEPVIATLRRENLRAMQTPQGFETALVRRAHEAGATMSEHEHSAAPDDAALVELLGEEVVLIPGSQESMKITTQFDLAVAELFASRKVAAADQPSATES